MNFYCNFCFNVKEFNWAPFVRQSNWGCRKPWIVSFLFLFLLYLLACLPKNFNFFIYFSSLTELQSLQLQSNEIRSLNKSLQQLKKIEYLRLDQNKLESITPNEISACSNLIYLNVSHNKLESLNVSFIFELTLILRL